MDIARISVTGVSATVTERLREIPAGIVGATVQIDYSGSVWADLSKVVVFRGNVTKDIIPTGITVSVPPEVVATPGVRLRVGVYGVGTSGEVVIPTLWAELGIVKASANPNVDIDTSLPVWAQILSLIGNLDNLETEARENLVAAVNELVGKSGSADPEEIKRIVEDYLAANPREETDPTVPDWAKQPEKPGYTAEEVGALAQGELQTGIDQALAQAKESGLFDGPQGPQGPEGPQGVPGNDYILTPADKTEIAEQAAELVDVPESSGGIPIPETAAVGQTIKVSAVDATGKPTAWEAVDFPSGGGDLSWKHIADVTVNTEISEVTLTEDDSGNPFAYKEIFMILPNPQLSGYLYARCGANLVSTMVQAWLTAGKATQMHYGLIDGNIAIINAFRSDGHLGFMNNFGGSKVYENISYLQFGASAGFTAEQTIRIYGR